MGGGWRGVEAARVWREACEWDLPCRGWCSLAELFFRPPMPSFFPTVDGVRLTLAEWCDVAGETAGFSSGEAGGTGGEMARSQTGHHAPKSKSSSSSDMALVQVRWRGEWVLQKGRKRQLMSRSAQKSKRGVQS